MNFVLVAKETNGFETNKFNITSVNENNIETLYNIAKSSLQLFSEKEIEVKLYLETYNNDGSFIEYSKYVEETDEFVAITTAL